MKQKELELELAGRDRSGNYIIMAHPYDVAIVRDYCGPEVIGKDLAEALVQRFNQHPGLLDKINTLVDKLNTVENELQRLRATGGRVENWHP